MKPYQVITYTVSVLLALATLGLAGERTEGPGAVPAPQGQPAQFLYSCKEQPFQKALDAIAKHYGQKVTCGDPEVAAKKMTMEIKSNNFWHAVCEASRQSGVGFLASGRDIWVEGNGDATFLEGQAPVNTCRAFHSGAVALYAPVPLMDRRKSGEPQPGLTLALYQNTGVFAESSVDKIVITMPKEEPQTVQLGGYTTGAVKTKWHFLLPVLAKDKPASVSFRLAASTYVDRRDYTLECRAGSELTDKDIKVKITGIEDKDGRTEIKYALQWDSGLTVEEGKKNKELIEKWLAGTAPSDEDKKWAEALKASKRVRLLNITRCSLRIASGEVLDTKGQSWSKRVPGVDIHGAAVFEKPTTIEGAKLVLTVAYEKEVDEDIVFSVSALPPSPEPKH
jgi:hypothetical protein